MQWCYKKSVNRLLFLFVFTALLSFDNNSYAQHFYVPQTFNYNTGEASERLTGDQLYAHTLSDTMVVYCNDWDSIPSPSTWRTRHKMKSNNSFIKFEVDKGNLLTNYITPVGYTYWLTYDLYGFYDPGDTIHGFIKSTDTLAISYNNAPDNSPYQDKSIRKYSNYYKLIVVITGIYEDVSGSLAPANLTDSAKRNFFVEGSILTQHYDLTHYGISASPPVIDSCHGYPGRTDSDYVYLSWDFGSGALITPVNYELEWSYVDDYKVDLGTNTTASIPPLDLQYDFSHNSTRVWLNDNSFTIPNCHSSGYLVYRVRAVRPDSVLYKYPVYGAWSLSSDAGTVGVLAPVQNYYKINTPYTRDNLNWQYTASFGEGGKFKHVATFYDGLLKNRQSITRSGTANKIVATDNVYDYEGRLSIKTLPIPVFSSFFSYTHDIAMNWATHSHYQASDFDSGFSVCPLVAPPPPFDSTALGSFYYSHKNVDTNDSWNKYIPDAQGYPFVQTTFQPGFNDRVAAQGGAGAHLQIGDTNLNYTTNSYVSPAPKDLNALFGNNIGWSSYYTMTVNKDPNQQLSMVVKDYQGKQMASAMIGLGPNSADHAIESVSVPSAVFYKQDLLNPASPNQVVDSIANTRIADIDFFNQSQATDSLQYSYAFLPFQACPGQYLSVKGHYSSVITDRCGQITMHEDTVLGTNSVGSSSTPITYYSPSSFFAQAAPYHLHKILTFYPYDVDEALDSLYNRPAGCFRSELSFIKESVDNTIFPCPSSSKPDSTPCDKLKWEMMQQLLPGAAYGQYSTASGYVVGTSNSIFSINCPPDTFSSPRIDTIPPHYCYYVFPGPGSFPYHLTPVSEWIDSTTLEFFRYGTTGGSWVHDTIPTSRMSPWIGWTVSGYVDILKDTCAYVSDTITVPIHILFFLADKMDSLYATFNGTDTEWRCSGYLGVGVHDTLSNENGALVNGLDTLGSIISYIDASCDIYVNAKISGGAMFANYRATLPSGKTIYINLNLSGIQAHYTGITYHTYSAIDSIGPPGYSAGNCGYTPGAHYRYQDTCTVPSLPDTITVAGIFYSGLRTMRTDSFVMIYNGAIAEGNYSIAEALLPLHPQYCELKHCFNDTFKTQVSAIPDWHIAQSLALFYLDSLIAHDPLVPLMTTSGIAAPSPADSLRTFPGGKYPLDTFILMNAYCSCNDSMMFRQCATSMFANEITNRLLVNDQVKTYYFNHVASVYFANRQKYVDKVLTQGGDSCSNCSLARMTLDPAAVVSPAPYPIGFTGADSAFSGSGNSGWMAGVLKDSASSAYDSTLISRLHDSTLALYRYSDSSIAYETIDTIIAKLSNCIAGNSTLATNIRDTLSGFYQAGAVSQGNFSQQQIRYALTSNGIAFSDLCNPYLIDCFQFGTQPHSYDCLPSGFYSGMNIFLNSDTVRYARWYGGTRSYLLDTTGNLFECRLSHMLSYNNSAKVSLSYDYSLSAFIIMITTPYASLDTVRVFINTTALVGFTYGMGTACINTAASSPGDGLINQYSFIDTISSFGVTTVAYGWIDSMQTMTYGNTAISKCVPCTQMRDLYMQFTDSMAADSIYGADHPYYDAMLANFMNASLRQLYTSADYERFIQSCALADSMLMPLYTGYATYTFSNTADMDSFISMLNRIDPNYSFNNSYRDSTVTGSPKITVCIDLNPVPVSELWIYKDSLNSYTGSYVTKITDMPLSTLQPTGEIGFIYLPPTYAFTPADSNIIDTSRAGFTGYPKAVWIGGRFVTQTFYDVIAKPGTPPYVISQDVYKLANYMNKVPGAVFIPSYMSTINADYFKTQKQAFLSYNYRYQQLSPYNVLDSIQPQLLTARIPSYSGYTAAYSQPFATGAPTNLYLDSSGMSNRYYDTLQRIINLAGTSGNIFYGAKSINILPGPPNQLDAYICGDGSYWYRYFTTGDTLFNVRVAFPAYIPPYLRQYYSVAAPVVPVPCDSQNRSFLLKLVKAGTTDTIQAYGRASFVIGQSIELDNVLLGNPITGMSAGPSDTFDNCERQLLNSAVTQGIVNYNNYMDSAKQGIKAAFSSYLVNSVQEQLQLGYWNDEFNYTLYNYDRAGNLVLTVPPMGSNPIPNTGTTLDDIDTARADNAGGITPLYFKQNTYQYNTVNQVKTQTTIDGGTTNFFYDAAGRLVFSQNAKQAQAGKYTYNIYDQQSRIIETGESIFGGPPDPYTIKYVNLLPNDSIVRYIHGSNPYRYDVVMTIYDTAALDLSTKSGQDAQQNLRKRVSCVKYFEMLDTLDIADTGYNYATHYSYDMDGNVQTLVQDFPELDHNTYVTINQRYKRIDYDYDQVSGKVNMLSYNRGRADQFYQQYLYDSLNRLSKVQTSNDGYIWHQDAAYTYYQHGPLAREEVGYPHVQGIDYAYTIQGWLKAMNGDTTGKTVDMGGDGNDIVTSKDAVAYSIDYFKDDYNAITSRQLQHVAPVTRSLYNGNIARQTVAISTFQRLNKQYVYDQLNRIRSATYASVDPVYNTLTGLTDYHSHYDYDGDGNLQTLIRYGNDPGGGAMIMDSLSYQYGISGADDKLNQLMDYSPNNYTNAGDILYDISVAPKYQYDAIGNTIQDLVSSQDTIEWNLYNKVSRTVNNTDGSQIIFGYDGAGNRVKKAYTQQIGFTDIHRADYYVHDAQGNVLAIYHQSDTLITYPVVHPPNYRFSLAEHDIYGMGRLGVKKYFPWQLGLHYQPVSGAYVCADSGLWNHVPWYSLEYQDVIKTDSLNLYGNAHTDSFYLTNMLGQKQYEITDHLGDVLATVSDKRAADSVTGPLILGGHVQVATWKPIVLNAYDYYPFGEYMPGRSFGDTTSQCITLTSTAMVPALYPIWQPWHGSTPWTPTFLGGVGGFSSYGTYIQLNCANPGDGFDYTVPVAAGVPQSISVNLTYYGMPDGYNINILNPISGMPIATRSLSGFGFSGPVAVSFTPTTSSVIFEIMETSSAGYFFNLDLYGISYDSVAYVPSLVTSVVCNEDGYEYGHNGQMKVNDIAGLGNHYTSLYGEMKPQTGGRWNPDPVPNPSQSPYATFNDNPILNKDPLGNVGEPVVNGNTLTIYSDVYFYGGASTGKLAATAANNMQSEWSAAHGTVTFQGKEYHNVQYKVTAHNVSEKTAQQMAAANQGEGYDPRMNFARIENGSGVENRVAGGDPDGDNSMFLRAEDIYDGGTSQAHEMGHGYGMGLHVEGVVHGQPRIMTTINSIVDDVYRDVNGKLNRDCRQVTQDDINGMKINKYSPGLGAGSRVGGSTNNLFDKNGRPTGGEGTDIRTPTPTHDPSGGGNDGGGGDGGVPCNIPPNE